MHVPKIHLSITRRLLCAGAIAAGLSGCGIANPYWTAGTVALAGPQTVTGRNSFYWTERLFGRSCDSYTIYDLPTRCINQR